MTTQAHQALLETFPFDVPAGYRWLIDRGLAGFEPNSSLQPWYLLPSEQVFCVNDRWPRAEETSRLYAYARRQDCDDLACFAIVKDEPEPRVVLIHGWTPKGYEVLTSFDSIWGWLRNVLSDIEEWVALEKV